MARVSPYELGNVAAFVYEAAKGSPGEWSSPQPKCPSLAPKHGRVPTRNDSHRVRVARLGSRDHRRMGPPPGSSSPSRPSARMLADGLAAAGSVGPVAVDASAEVLAREQPDQVRPRPDRCCPRSVAPLRTRAPAGVAPAVRRAAGAAGAAPAARAASLAARRSRTLHIAVGAQLGGTVGSLSRHLLSLLLIGVVAWLPSLRAYVLENLALRRYQLEVEDNLQARRVHTQVMVLRRITVIAAVLLVGAAMPMTFRRPAPSAPAFARVGRYHRPGRWRGLPGRCLRTSSQACRSPSAGRSGSTTSSWSRANGAGSRDHPDLRHRTDLGLPPPHAAHLILRHDPI